MPTWTSITKRSQSPDKEKKKKGIENVGARTTVAGLNMLTLESVGLVTGLNGTGDDPPPSSYRKQMLDEMRRRGVKSPNQVLRSPNTALVIVRAYLPPLVKKGDSFDVEVRIPGASEATSLSGGTLLTTRLSEQAMVQGRGILKGHVMAVAKGPILISARGDDKDSEAGLLRRGRILGGGTSMTNRKLSMYLRAEYRSVRNSQRTAKRIGKRFHRYTRHGTKEALAVAKTDQKIELDIVARYKDNYPRYLRVIRQIAWNENQVKQGIRIEKLKKELQNPITAERAALNLEAIGKRAIPVLQEGLKSKTLESRFHAAMALAYLGEPDGLEVLKEVAQKEPAFRAFAFAAMAASEEPEANLYLHDLMSVQSAETRYGAFRTLSVLDKNDPFIYGELLNNQFRLHEVRSKGKPMIHLTHYKKAEVVLFGANQKFHTPLVLKPGRIIVKAQAGSEEVTVSLYLVNQPDRTRTVSRRVADVIRAATELGATYPDIAMMLAQAGTQGSLPGSLEMDALPRTGRVYHRPTVDGKPSSKKKVHIGRKATAPNMFAFLEENPNKGTASAMDIRSTKNETETKEDQEKEDQIEDQISESSSPQKTVSSWSKIKSWMTLPKNPFNRLPQQYEPEID